MERERLGQGVIQFVLTLAALAWIAWDLVKQPAPLWVLIAIVVVALVVRATQYSKQRQSPAESNIPRHETLAILCTVLVWASWLFIVTTFNFEPRERLTRYSYGIAWLVVLPVLRWLFKLKGQRVQPANGAEN